MVDLGRVKKYNPPFFTRSTSSTKLPNKALCFHGFSINSCDIPRSESRIHIPLKKYPRQVSARSNGATFDGVWNRKKWFCVSCHFALPLLVIGLKFRAKFLANQTKKTLRHRLLIHFHVPCSGCLHWLIRLSAFTVIGPSNRFFVWLMVLTILSIFNRVPVRPGNSAQMKVIKLHPFISRGQPFL